MAESRKRANESVAEEVDCKILIVELGNVQLVSQKQIKLEPLSPYPAVTDNLIADDDEPVIGIEEFNPNYLKREPTSPSSSSDVNSPPRVASPEVDQLGAGRFKITDKQSAHNNYLSTTSFQPTKPTGHLLHTLADLKQPLTEHLTALLAEHHGIKVFLVLDVEYESIIDVSKQFSDHLHTHFMPLFSVAEIPQFLTAVNQELILRNENFVQFKSGLRLKKITQVTVSAAEHQPIAGSSYTELPPFLILKKCIINVKNRDNRCFGYALLASLEPSENNKNNPYSYTRHFARRNSRSPRSDFNDFSRCIAISARCTPSSSCRTLRPPGSSATRFGVSPRDAARNASAASDSVPRDSG